MAAAVPVWGKEHFHTSEGAIALVMAGISHPMLFPNEPSQLPLHPNTTSSSNEHLKDVRFYIPQVYRAGQYSHNAYPQMSTPTIGAPQRHGYVGPSAIEILEGEKAFWSVFPHDYDFHTLLEGYPHDVNFTAVEIIVFLPYLFLHEDIARRFANNKILTPEHAFILKRFRGFDYPTTLLDIQYREALSPYPISGTGEILLPRHLTWKRTKHRAPLDWDPSRININEFVPDRVRRNPVGGVPTPNRVVVPAPEPVPFKNLLKGVIQLPEGEDAADLTRAIQFACAQFERAKDYLGHPPMFPTDLVPILRLINHAPISDKHHDHEIQQRYNIERSIKKYSALRYPLPPSSPISNESTLANTPKPNLRRDLGALHDYQEQVDALIEEFDGNLESSTGFTAEDYEELFGEPAPKRLKRTHENSP